MLPVFVSGVDGGAIGAAEGDDGAGVLKGAAPLGALEAGGVAGISSFFLQPARAANTTAVANIVLRINIGSPLWLKISLPSVRWCRIVNVPPNRT